MQTIINFSGAGYSETGSWGAGGATYRYTTDTSATATFLFTGLTAGTTYYLGFTWPVETNNVTNAKWTVTGTAASPTGTFNEQIGSGYNDGTNTYLPLGSFVPTGTTLSVTVSYPTSPVAGPYFTAIAAMVRDTPLPVTSTISVATGNWSSASTWSGGFVPTSSLDVIVAQPYTVTVDVPSAAKTVQVVNNTTSTTTGLLLVNSTLALAATTGQALGYTPVSGNAPSVMLTIGVGGLITANPASGQTVTFEFGTGGGFLNAAWSATGTGWGAGQFAEVQNIGAGTLSITTTGGYSSNFYGAYVKFTGINGGISATANGSYGSPAGSPGGFLLDHALFSGCGQLSVTCDATTPFRFNGVRFTGSLGSYSARLDISPPNSGIERTHDLGSYDIIAELETQGLSFTNTFFGGNFYSGGSGNPVWPTFDSCFVRKYDPADYPTLCGGDVTNSYWLWDKPGQDNAHFLTCNTTASGTASITGNIFDGPAVAPTTDTGDCIAGLPPSMTIAVDWNLVLPIATGAYAGYACGDLIAGTGALSTVVSANNNTIVGSLNAGAMYFGESYAGYAGMWTSVRSNLVVDLANLSGLTEVFSHYGGAGGTTDVAYAANITNNGGFNLATGTAGVGYTAVFSTGSPGAGDVHGNPNFVDPTRNFPTWAVSHGSTGSTMAARIADGLAYLAADPSLIASSLVPWVRAGFAPTNAAFHGSGHAGTDIGAIAYFASAPTFRRNMGLRAGSRGVA